MNRAWEVCLGRWRAFAGTVMVTLLSVCALTFMRTHPDQIDAALSHIRDAATRDQMRSPVALTMMLPVGVKGSLLAICLMGIIAGDGIHLHSWGSIFIQDVVLPLASKAHKKSTGHCLYSLRIFVGHSWRFSFSTPDHPWVN